jgi:6-phosphogluconate dehydrogenase
MPGGQKDVLGKRLRSILKSIAAKYIDGEPCVEYIGRVAAVIMSKWFIMASNMAICN